MEVKVKELGLKFSVPDRPTVRQQLNYNGHIFANRLTDVFWRNWQAATALIEDWDCKAIPDFKLVYDMRMAEDEAEQGAVYLDEATDPTITNILIRVGNEVAVHVAGLEDMPKNS